MVPSEDGMWDMLTGNPETGRGSWSTCGCCCRPPRDKTYGALQGARTRHGVDMFYTRVYQYYFQQGFAHIVVKLGCSMALLTFTVMFASFLAVAVDWSAVTTCSSPSTCSVCVLHIPWQPTTECAADQFFVDCDTCRPSETTL